MQLLSTTDPDEAWPDFKASRTAALQQLPPTIDPNQLIQLLSGPSGSSSWIVDSSSESHNSTVKNFVFSGAAEDASADSSNDKLTSLVEKYGPVIIALSVGNLVIGSILCIIGVVVCLRFAIKSGPKRRSIDTSYAPIRFKEADAVGVGNREFFRG